MTRPVRRALALAAGGLLLAAALVLAFRPPPVPVQTATIGRGPLQVTVEEEGETRVRDRYVISSPVAGYMRRIELRPGDPVERGRVLVRIEPPPTALLDPRARAEASARVEAARALLARAEIVAGQAAAEHARLERLAAGGAATRQAVETAAAGARAAASARDAARAELAAAEAALRLAGAAPAAAAHALRAPVTGRVLAVHRHREGVVAPGEPLLELGDTNDLEIAVPVLSQDAARIRPGTRVLLEQWGGPADEGDAAARLAAVVRRIEPEGFTRVSALGVEEQRVMVLADPVAPIPDTLGAGYRVIARFVIWEGADVLQVPTGALFRHGDGWAVFVVEAGRAALRAVDTGRQAGLAAEIRSGLREGDVVIVHPPRDVADGVRVRP